MPPLILDRRSLPTRTVLGLWQRLDGAAPAPVRWLAGAAARIGSQLLDRRVSGREPARAGPVVVSIGNLALGGTGKTPVTLSLAEELGRRGIDGAVLTRGYRARRRGTFRVRAEDPEAGDEARLLAARLPAWTVLQAVDRSDGLAQLIGREPAPEVVVLEDGYQTARVGRHLDVLILDRWRVEGEYLVPVTGLVQPFGPYRESAAGAARASVWLVESDRQWTGPDCGRIAGRLVPVVPFSRRLVWPEGPDPDGFTAYGVLSGLARPERFEAGCARRCGMLPAVLARFDDHADYRPADLNPVLRAGQEAGVQGWLTTAKDWIKLQTLWPVEVPVAVAELEVVWLAQKTLPDLVEERLRRKLA
jgi:tetraacyldisaccharide 4'-kinase